VGTAGSAPRGASLVIQTSFLGDLVLTTPLIAELATRGPVDVVVTPGGAPLLAHHPAVRDVIIFDKRGANAGLPGLWSFGRSLRTRADGSRRVIDAAYLAQGSLRSAVLARIAGASQSIGFDTSGGRAFYSTRIRYDRSQHHAERLWRLAVGDAEPVGDPERIRPRLYPGEDERAMVDELLRQGPFGDRPLVALAPGSIWGTKRWPYFAELAAALADRYRLVVIGGRDDAALADAIVQGAGPERALDATGRLTLLASAELIRRCAALVTNDSAPQHLASAVGTPTLTIYGPTVPEFGFGPLAPKHRTAGLAGLDCRPCHPHGPKVCPKGHFRCMRDLGISDIERTFAALVAESA
jgi:heptosyltransferase-2